MVKQLLQNTYVDPRENLYDHPEELKEFWFGTPLMLAGKFPDQAILNFHLELELFLFFMYIYIYVSLTLFCSSIWTY